MMRRLLPLVVLVAVGCINGQTQAKDYFVTIGGGYEPSGNQASLEANVHFFQRILNEKHRGTRVQEVYFADGSDPEPDLQVSVDQPYKNRPASELLSWLHRRNADVVEYRNHRVSNTSGPNSPDMVRQSILRIAQSARAGDRLFIYVTSHGSAGKRRDAFNTTIDGWDKKSFSAREFAQWLDHVENDVPVIMVMAQCYCGGFAHTIFEDLDPTQGLSKKMRIGFFAQQHDLPAAGCRPDIENDEEFSSYFWGAMLGRTRSNKPSIGSDVNRDGHVSFAEAFAQSVIASDTIDIPMKASGTFLRTFSAIGEKNPQVVTREQSLSRAILASDATPPNTLEPIEFMGSMASVSERSNPVSRRVVVELCKQLDFSMQDDITMTRTALQKQQELRRRNQGGRRRTSSGRRELLEELGQKWPELADRDQWEDSNLLKNGDQQKLFDEIKSLSTFETFESRRVQRAKLDEQNDRDELRETKIKRLIATLEEIILESNLEIVASPETNLHYRAMVALEAQSLD